MLTFTYESASRLTDLFFEAINNGLLEQNQKAQKKRGNVEIKEEESETIVAEDEDDK